MSYDYYVLEQYVLQKEGYPELKIRKLHFLGNEFWEWSNRIDSYKEQRWEKSDIQDETIIRDAIEKYAIICSEWQYKEVLDYIHALMPREDLTQLELDTLIRLSTIVEQYEIKTLKEHF